MADLSAGLDQLTIVEDLGQRPDEDWTIRETLARLCDLGPWITASTAATRCSDDPDAITDAAAILAEHVWLAPDGPHHREPEGEPVSYDTGRPLVDVYAVGLMDPEHAIKLRWDDELGVGDSEVVDVHTTEIVQVTLDQRVDVRSLHATVDPVGFLPDVLLQSLQELPNGRAVGRAEMTWHHLGKARRNVVRAGEGWDLIGDGCNPEGSISPFFAADDALYTLWPEGSAIHWQPLADE
jgi:hypothetical protein